MRLLTTILTITIISASGPMAASAGVQEKEFIEKILRFKGDTGERLVVVDNVFGSIEVTGYDGDDVRVKISKRIEARSEKKMEQAKEEVSLDIYEENDLIELYVDGPFREKRDRNINWRGYKHEGYKVYFDFEIEVPKGCSVVIKTVNDGEIFVGSINGDFEVNNVNGGIKMEKIGGSGEARTVNGDVTLDFARNPAGDCRFATINGQVRLYFLSGLSADFYLKTFNGDIFTDFEVKTLPAETFHAIKKNGKKVYRSGHTSRVRAGDGGPDITLDGFNGDMFILEK